MLVSHTCLMYALFSALGIPVTTHKANAQKGSAYLLHMNRKNTVLLRFAKTEIGRKSLLHAHWGSTNDYIPSLLKNDEKQHKTTGKQGFDKPLITCTVALVISCYFSVLFTHAPPLPTQLVFLSWEARMAGCCSCLGAPPPYHRLQALLLSSCCEASQNCPFLAVVSIHSFCYGEPSSPGLGGVHVHFCVLAALPVCPM